MMKFVVFNQDAAPIMIAITSGLANIEEFNSLMSAFVLPALAFRLRLAI